MRTTITILFITLLLSCSEKVDNVDNDNVPTQAEIEYLQKQEAIQRLIDKYNPIQEIDTLTFTSEIYDMAINTEKYVLLKGDIMDVVKKDDKYFAYFQYFQYNVNYLFDIYQLEEKNYFIILECDSVEYNYLLTTQKERMIEKEKLTIEEQILNVYNEFSKNINYALIARLTSVDRAFLKFVPEGYDIDDLRIEIDMNTNQLLFVGECIDIL